MKTDTVYGQVTDTGNGVHESDKSCTDHLVVEKLLDGPVVSDRRTIYFNRGKVHREDGPAIEWAYGTKMWYREGQPHREDGPAVEWANGTKEWYREGELYRA